MQISHLRNKKIGVLGLGTEGFSTARFLLKKGIKDITLLDQNEKLVPNEISQLQKIFGKSYLNSLGDFDVIFRSPGVNPKKEEIKDAKKNGVFFTTQTQEFLKDHSLQTIGVTGTKGKGTTSSLLFNIFRNAGKKVFLGGNIGTPPFDFIDRVDETSTVVLELSSFQLYDLQVSPHIAVVLMVTSEHLDWHLDTEDYINAKGNIARFQNEDDLLIVNSDYEASNKISSLSPAQKYFYSTKFSLEDGSFVEETKMKLNTGNAQADLDLSGLKIPGLHNLQNVSAAVLVSFLEGVEIPVIQESINEFEGLPDRLELVREINGVCYYNDSASTTPETAVAAINSFDKPKVMILGGSSKNSDFTQLGKAVNEASVKAVILIGQEASKIKQAIKKEGDFHGELFEGLRDMTEVVKKANEVSEGGDVVLLSPGCASFGMFENYVSRGKEFKEAVGNL